MALIRIAAALVLVLVLALALQLSAAAPPDRCTHVCGHMRVPYPFGIGPPDAGCYLPGLNLTCDTSRRGAPRLLIGAGAGAVGLQVVDIFLHNSTLRVVQSGDVAIGANGRGLFNGDLRDHGPYKLLSSENELVVTGCNVMATLLDRNSSIVMSACASFCQDLNGPYVTAMDMGSCKEPVVGTRDEVAGYVQLTRFSQNATMDEERQRTQVFVAENGWFDRHLNASLAGASLVEGAMSAVPLLLQWDVVDLELGRPPPNEFDKWFSGCPTDLALKICRSGNSTCYQSGGYSCSCSEGYDGNPYVNGTEGCHDIDECKRAKDNRCFGECTNTLGSFECRCPPGTSGNHSIPNGCVNLDHGHRGHFGLIIGLSVASFPTIILSVLGAIFLNRKLQHQRAKQLKQKFFNQNRGQLLQQLVSHRTDIAERMIIPLEELEKATNNFDQARKIGGGGHGIVYKGILSDLHVVAIKKSKIVVQREIDEFINEVAILSQINHRNVVKLYGCCLESEVPLLAYEFISNGTLSDLLHKKPPISILWEDRLRIVTEIAKALAYLHTAVSIPVVHRDIKSSNILLDDASLRENTTLPCDQSHGKGAYLHGKGFAEHRLAPRGAFAVCMHTAK
ncbi:wall-associated receptor kinase 5 [Lolium perenne]|uniref:wall-associated receptor kinase 5 n=1 Tax=Lolium perenne TaxID=4522 RepID=UPI0021F64504|nr:wall-associated receptor kinase 5-like [Lolium perenne]